MFDLVHKNKRIIQVFLGLIALTFATWGIESYTRMQGGRDTVASVNGLDISAREFEEELRRRQDQLRQALGPNYDPAQFDTPDLRRGLLDSMVSQRLVAAAAHDAAHVQALRVGDGALSQGDRLGPRAARLRRKGEGANLTDRRRLTMASVLRGWSGSVRKPSGGCALPAARPCRALWRT